MKVEHIAIPLDEAEVFKEEEKHQQYLVETLLYSTKVVAHYNQLKVKSLLVITKRHFWLEDETPRKRNACLPLAALLHLLKAENHPELVLISTDDHDNLRISAASEQRCHHIISALAFHAAYLAVPRAPLRLYSIRQSTLMYFERTVKEKKTGPKLALQRYSCSLLHYEEPGDSPDLFGKLVINRFVLAKQLYVEGGHLIHIAVVNDQNSYLCHTLDKQQAFAQRLQAHKNMEAVQPLCYARALEYKLQLLFEYLPSLKPRSIKVTRLFEEVFRLYEVVRAGREGVGWLSYDMLLRESEESSKLLLREFRYRELGCEWEQKGFAHVRLWKETSERDYYVNKMYGVGLIMYQHLYGRAPFEHEDLQVSLQLSQGKTVAFPALKTLKSSKRLEEFIQCCLTGKFESKRQVQEHQWLAVNKIQL